MQAMHFEVGLIQTDTRKGIKKTLRILQIFSDDLKNKFKTQLSSKELWSEEWGIDLEAPLEYEKLEGNKGLKPLLFAASNKRMDKKAMKVGAAIFVDTSRYPVEIKTWSVTFYRGDSGQILINKKILKTYRSSLVKSDTESLFDYVDSIHRESLDLQGIGDTYHIVEKAKNFLLFESEKDRAAKVDDTNVEEVAEAEAEKLKVDCASLQRHPKLSTIIETSVFYTGEPSPLDRQTHYTEYSVDSEGTFHKVKEFRNDYEAMVKYRKAQLAKVVLAESIVEDQEKEVKDDKDDVIAQAMALSNVKVHDCAVKICAFLYNRVYVDGSNEVTRTLIVNHMMDNYEWSESTVRRKIEKLERSKFLVDADGQIGKLKAYKVIGFDKAFEAQIKNLCEMKGWKFGGRKLLG